MRIVKLVAENFKKLTAVEIIPKDDMVLITGINGAGKSSVLDAITAILCGGKSIPEKPIRKGADKGKIIIDMGAFTITRSFTKDNTYLKIEKADGKNVSSPQKFLDELVGNVSFDPLEFINNNSPKEQRSILLQLTGVNVDDLDKEEKGLREQRTEIGRDVKKSESLYQATNYYPDMKETEEVSLSTLSDKLKEAMEFNGKLQADGVANENLKEGAKANIVRIEEIKVLLVSLKEELHNLQVNVADRKETYQAEKARLNELVFLPIEPIELEIQNIDTKNRQIRANQSRKKAEEEFNECENEYNSLTQQIEEIESRRKTILESSIMPVPGLSFDEDGLLYNNIPLAQASDGEKLMISLGISMALNPTLRVLRIKDGSLLDERNRQIIRDTIKEKDYQLWYESVGSDSKVGIVIEEGEIVAVDGVKVESKKSGASPKKKETEITAEEMPKEKQPIGDEEW